MNEMENSSPARDEKPVAGGARRRYLRLLLPLIVIIVAVLVAFMLMATKPHAVRTTPAGSARLVDVLEATFSPSTVVVEANGIVGASREVTLMPRVTGEVLSLSPMFLPGGVVGEDETLLTIDAADYELALRQQESTLAQAEAAWKIELGQQEVARQEFDMLGETIDAGDGDLALRVPQLEQAKATLETAEAAVDQARLNLERTRITVPFNALVRTRNVVEGAQVGVSTQLGSLVGTDEYWVEVVVPVDRLKWIDIPVRDGGEGSPVRVYDTAAWSDGAAREGRVLQLAADLEDQGRMARLIVSVPDPLALLQENAGKPALLIGSYVAVEIVGHEIPAAADLDRSLLRDGDEVWVMNDEDQLEIRPVTVAYRGRDTVLVTGGLEPGERIVETDLGSAVAGLALRTDDDQSSGAPDGAKESEARQ